MRRDSQAITSADESGLAPLPPAPPGLEELVAAVRTAVSRPADWQGAAELGSQELTRHLPSSDVLGPEQRIGDPDGYRSHLLYSEPAQRRLKEGSAAAHRFARLSLEPRRGEP